MLKNTEQIKELTVDPNRLFYSATHEEIVTAATTDVYFVKTHEILDKMNLNDVEITAEIFARKKAMLAGIGEVVNLLKDLDIKLWAMDEGTWFEEKEPVVRIQGRYQDFGVYETAILGMLASSTGWATAAAEVKVACEGKPFFSFGARHVHPSVAPVMERAAIIGGATGASCILGAKLADKEPVGTVPHAIFLVVGDTLKVAQAYDEIMPPDALRLVLVDTFKDEAEETLRIAREMNKKLDGIRLDTPSERGGVTPGLIKEIRARLDMEGFEHIQIFVSGGLTPERIPILSKAGANAFGVGSYISGARAIDMTMDIKEINGKPIAKRGRIPGITYTDNLKQIK
ncbi:MAG: nicotinate phosphoribosyltransferase [Bacillota bacterium]|nr:nicotinate phosphoribosyltransferase [Bacillota bacterium]